MTTERPLLHIALSANKGYMPHLCVTLASVLVNNPSYRVVAHIVSNDFGTEEKQAVIDTCIPFKAEAKFYSLGSTERETFQNSAESSLSVETFSRCFLPKLLGKEVERVLYLDCDLLVRHSLQSLWEMPLEGVAVGAVEEVMPKDLHESMFGRLGYAPQEGYFNAGVLLMNLQYWREHEVLQQCIDTFHRERARIVYDDQDVLNLVLRGKVRYVAPRYNCTLSYYKTECYPQLRNGWKDLLSEIEDPTIIHFIGTHKPWRGRCNHPLENEYFYYLRFTPLSPPSFGTKLHRLWRKTTRKLHLRRQPAWYRWQRERSKWFEE